MATRVHGAEATFPHYRTPPLPKPPPRRSFDSLVLGNMRDGGRDHHAMVPLRRIWDGGAGTSLASHLGLASKRNGPLLLLPTSPCILSVDPFFSQPIPSFSFFLGRSLPRVE